MIALDTNVLVRLFVRDHEEQCQRAVALVERAQAEGHACFVPDVVLAETVWVLQRSYRMPREAIAEVLSALAETAGIAFRSDNEFEAALAAYVAGSGGFVDYFIRENSRSAGCQVVYTFDAQRLSQPGFAPP